MQNLGWHQTVTLQHTHPPRARANDSTRIKIRAWGGEGLQLSTKPALAVWSGGKIPAARIKVFRGVSYLRFGRGDEAGDTVLSKQ